MQINIFSPISDRETEVETGICQVKVKKIRALLCIKMVLTLSPSEALQAFPNILWDLNHDPEVLGVAFSVSH